MIPDLGSYAAYVLSAYAVSLALLGALVVLSVRRARRVKAQLDKVEKGRAHG